MNSIVDKLVTLSLNANWQPIGFKTVKDAIIDMCGVTTNGKPKSLALDINYNIDDDGMPLLNEPLDMNPVKWEDWINLPVRAWDLSINSVYMTIRVPTVIISTTYAKMPLKRFLTRPSKDAIYNRDEGICQYTGKKITRRDASVDHIIPKSKGGEDSWTNLVLCSKEVNLKKGNKSNKEIGLKLMKEPKKPTPMPMYAFIKDAKHEDWNHFLIK